MKRKPFILVAFLLCLYLVPSFVSAASWIEVTSADMEFDTPGWNNITIAELEFVTPEPPSAQSITGFNETLLDDVLYYPDSFANTTESLATNGDDDYIDSLAVDAVTWLVSFGTHEGIIFDYNTEIILDGFTYHHYGYYSSTPNPAWCALEYYNSFTDTWDTVMNFTRDTPVNPHWTNDTFYFPDTFTPLALLLRVIASSSDSSTGSTDYLGIEMIYLTTYSDESYAESFSELSDWDLTGLEGGDVFTTDYDVANINTDSSAGSDYLWTNELSLDATSRYIELRYKMTGTATYARIYYWTVDDKGGSNSFDVLPHSTSWVTKKFYTTQAIECIELTIYKAAATDYDIFVDYLRASPSNETGLQHDFSTTTGISSSDGGTIDSDGDSVTLTADGDGSTFLIVVDTTTTATAIATTYYPFFGIDIDSGSGSWTLEQYDGAAYATLQSVTAISAGTKRFNMKALDTYVFWWKITLSATGILVADWAKAYSIADWSYSASSVTVGDYFYTDAEILYSEKASNESQQLTYDIELSTNTTIFEFANISTGVWTGTGDYSYGFDYDVGAGWEGYTYDETLIALDAGTLETVRIIVKDSGAISAISFTVPLSLWWEAALAELLFRVKYWVDVVTAVLNFLVELSEFTWFFILAGLIMIPTSTLFLVRGGKDDMSRDKIFLFFLIFLFGWAFVLGGLM